MPATNIEQLGQHEASLKKKIAGGESLEAAKKRELGKKLRRAQRKRRRLVVAAARNAVKPAPAAEGEAKPTQAEESKEE